MASKNGTELSPERQQMAENSIAQYVTQYHAVAAERDDLHKQNAALKTELAGVKAQLEIAELAASQLQSRSDAAMSVRDEAVARRAAVETVLGSMMAIGRAFGIANEPLIKGGDDDASDADRDTSHPFDK